MQQRPVLTSVVSFLKNASLVQTSVIDLFTTGLGTYSNGAYFILVPRPRSPLLLHLLCRAATKSVVNYRIFVASITFVKRKAW
jgi:hypothetical protein